MVNRRPQHAASSPRPTLWRHQLAVLPRLLAGHWLLLWDMGVGKTAAMIVAGEQAGGPQLWLSPAAIIPQTAQEIARWRPKAKVQIIASGKSSLIPGADVVICSYDLMRSMGIWKQLFARRWASCVCDEGHALGHTTAIRTRAFYGARRDSPGALFRRCDRVWVATGTPIMNYPDELWPHLSRLFPELCAEFVHQRDWVARFCITRATAYGQQIIGGRNLGELAQMLATCASRLALTDVADIPPLIVQTVPVEISREHRAAMNAALPSDRLEEIQIILDQIEGGNAAAWARLQAMMLPLASVRRVTVLAKAPACVALVEAELRGGMDRIAVFGSHIEGLKYVADKLKIFGCGLMIGETSDTQREAARRDFISGRNKVLVANTSVAGFGLNLQSARRCILLDCPWTPSALDQAIARLHRAGQTRPVHASLLSVARSIDERVTHILAAKRSVISQLTGALSA